MHRRPDFRILARLEWLCRQKRLKRRENRNWQFPKRLKRRHFRCRWHRTRAEKEKTRPKWLKLIRLHAVCVLKPNSSENNDIHILMDCVTTLLKDPYEKIFTNCRRILGGQTWGRLLTAVGEDLDPRIFPDKLTAIKPDLAAPEFIVDLARIEWALHQAKTEAAAFQRQIDKLTVNPTLVLIPVSWKNLAAVIETKPGEDPEVHESSDVHVIVWRHPKSGKIHIRETEDIDLLALKITVEEIDPREAAAIGDVPVGAIEAARHRAVSQGFLLSPASLIRRRFRLQPIYPRRWNLSFRQMFSPFNGISPKPAIFTANTATIEVSARRCPMTRPCPFSIFLRVLPANTRGGAGNLYRRQPVALSSFYGHL